ncbi:hypothetical protein Bbelb_040400 [Branchiostoma belcheri]|nr:hypothetical protein Bbelb_040400 [Branchiostoma belcheri]
MDRTHTAKPTNVHNKNSPRLESPGETSQRHTPPLLERGVRKDLEKANVTWQETKKIAKDRKRWRLLRAPVLPSGINEDVSEGWGRVAQSLARSAHTREVAGSNPAHVTDLVPVGKALYKTFLTSLRWNEYLASEPREVTNMSQIFGSEARSLGNGDDHSKSVIPTFEEAREVTNMLRIFGSEGRSLGNGDNH